MLAADVLRAPVIPQFSGEGTCLTNPLPAPAHPAPDTMIADQYAPSSGDVGALLHDAGDRRHFRAFRLVVQELARLVAHLEDTRGEGTSQMLTPAAAEILRQLAGRRPVALDALRLGSRRAAPSEVRALARAGLVEVAGSPDPLATPEVRLTVTGEFQLLLIDLPGLVRMAKASVGLTQAQLDATSAALRSLRTALERPVRRLAAGVP